MKKKFIIVFCNDGGGSATDSCPEGVRGWRDADLYILDL